MIDPSDLGIISPDEQADALRTLVALFATSVVRKGHEPRNAISAEILDILDEVPDDRAEAVAQLFAMMALRLRRRTRPRHTAFRLSTESALLAHQFAGGAPVENEADYLFTDRPGLPVVEAACDDLMARLRTIPKEDAKAWLTAQVIAAGLLNAERDYGVTGENLESTDMAVAEFLLRSTAQYLGSTAGRPGAASGPDGED